MTSLGTLSCAAYNSFHSPTHISSLYPRRQASLGTLHQMIIWLVSSRTHAPPPHLHPTPTPTPILFRDDAGHIQANLEDEYVKEALSKGLDLREFSQQIEEELQEVERDSVQDYLQESKNMAQLHVQIQDTDIILERMEDMLGLFQADLGNISGEIQSLQDQVCVCPRPRPPRYLPPRPPAAFICHDGRCRSVDVEEPPFMGCH